MKIHNLPLLQQSLSPNMPTIKFIMNDHAIVFFPVSQQHRDVKFDGVSYEEEYRGNAVAGLIVSVKAEIRFHASYTDADIGRLWRTLQNSMNCRGLALGNPSYQGRTVL